MNVAITRARRHLVVVGDERTLKCNVHWKQIIERATFRRGVQEYQVYVCVCVFIHTTLGYSVYLPICINIVCFYVSLPIDILLGDMCVYVYVRMCMYLCRR